MQRRMRFIPVVLAICFLAISALSVDATTMGDKKLTSLRSEYKKAVKQFKKEGWKVSGNSQSLEDAVERHFMVLEETGIDGQVIEGRATAKDLNLAMRRATNNAKSQYISLQQSDIEGRTQIDIVNEAGSEASTKTRVESHTASSSKDTLKGFKPTVSLYRKLPDGNYEAKSLYVVPNE